MQLPESLQLLLQPLFESLPLAQSMPDLSPKSGATRSLIKTLESIVALPPVASNPALQAGLWLYVDELDRSHDISQELKNPTGSYWHGIMHRREGDFSNSHYWLNRTGSHPAIPLLVGYDAHAFIDAAEAAYPHSPENLVRLQREEWGNLIWWCAQNR